MSAKCQTEGCTADATVVTTIMKASENSVVMELRCDDHKETRPQGTVSNYQALPTQPQL